MSEKLWNGKIKKIEVYRKSNNIMIAMFLADHAYSISPIKHFYKNNEEVYQYDEREYYYKSFDIEEKVETNVIFESYKTKEDYKDNIEKALEIAYKYGLETESEQKAWVIDQMVRALCNDDNSYKKFVDSYEEPLDDDGNYHVWNTGIAPKL